ncbi:MAG TPA: DUF5665 domain-containing protein [Roseovarius sp.]|nr:DUF5665 domain-containing protein [Roseovarius sp.]
MTEGDKKNTGAGSEDQTQDTLAREIAALRAEVAHLNTHRFVRIHNSIPRLLAFNFARGAAFALGTLLGASMILSALAWTVSQIEFLPVIGEWGAEIVRQIEAAAEAQ